VRTDTTVNFQLPELRDPADRYSDRLGHREMPMPNEGDVVALDDGSYRIIRLETHRVRLLHPPWVVLLTTATVESDA
jgi:hypothetical protein